MREPLMTLAAALGVSVLLVVAALPTPTVATSTATGANKVPREDKNFGLRQRPAVGDPVVRPFRRTPDGDEDRRSRLNSEGSGLGVGRALVTPPYATGHTGSSRPGVPQVAIPRFRSPVTYQETKAEPKQTKGPTTYPFTQPFTPSSPVSFSSFSFAPSHPPPGSNTGSRGGHSKVRPPPPARQTPNHHASPFPRPVQIRNPGPGSYYEDERERYPPPAYEEETPVGFHGSYEQNDEEEYPPAYDEEEEYPPTYDEEDTQADFRGSYERDNEKQEYPPPTYEKERHYEENDREKERQRLPTYDYEENERREHTPSYDDAKQFPDYDDDYEDFGYEDRHEFPYDNQDYDGPQRYEDEYHGTTPIFRGQYRPQQTYRPPQDHRNHRNHHDNHDDYPQPLYRGQDEEEEEEKGGGGGGKPCKTVQKNDMTCEVCRDEEGGFSEHCSHSSKNSHDEAFSSKRRQHKRDAATSAPRRTKKSQGSADPFSRLQDSPEQAQRSQSRVGAAEERSKVSSRPTINKTPDAPNDAKNSPSQGPSSQPQRQGGGAGALERQDTGFTFHDLDDYGFSDDLHDFGFSEGPDQRDLDEDHYGYDFGLGFNDHHDHHDHQQPEFYDMSVPQYSALPPPQTHAALRDTHARLEEAMDQFMSKDRTSCKKVSRRGMTCYQCPRGKGAAEEECMYARMKPDGHDLHYSEESTYDSQNPR
ncbi:adhesive plaque matrix protein-like isoform X2 [Eriocheir sinensis]|uniref:adhesive plaque matrix protein-like isoform X2 n=1 Tax=Eriocheir sinensis TaxID=95602 RepID=UPI0021C958D3|nr:adhesive plaque matrix protein-like isoform X2 [Eriocheir sinensis]